MPCCGRQILHPELAEITETLPVGVHEVWNGRRWHICRACAWLMVKEEAKHIAAERFILGGEKHEAVPELVHA